MREFFDPVEAVAYREYQPVALKNLTPLAIVQAEFNKELANALVREY